MICGKYTDKATGVSVELKIAQGAEKPYFLLEGRKDKFCERPRESKPNDEIYRWEPENLEKLLANKNNLSIAFNIGKKISDNFVNEAIDESSYGSAAKYQDYLLEQYKQYVEMTDRNSARRQIVNAFFLSINTALIGLFGYLATNDFTLASYIFSIIIAIAGLRLNVLWRKFIYSYRDLNAAKYKIINKVEERLPLNLYDTEWEALGRGEKLKSYLPHNSIEISIIWVFIILHSVFIFLLLWKIVKIIFHWWH